MERQRRWAPGLVAAIAVAVGLLAMRPAPATADHTWGGYHWARPANPVNLQLGNNLTTTNWRSHLAVTSADWSDETKCTATATYLHPGESCPTTDVLNTSVVAGAGLRRCGAVPGRVEVCNDRYGRNGWLGVASVWTEGGHITQATVKVNDTYLATPSYNDTWRLSVLCQEVGHTFGLGHQDESGADFHTCMDYANNPDEDNKHPNAHDYSFLASLYAHADSTTTVGTRAVAGRTTAPGSPFDEVGPEHPAEFGRPEPGHRDRYGRSILFQRDLGNGRRLFTWVYWAPPGQPGAP